MGALTAVPRLLAKYGVDSAGVLAAAALPADALDDPENRVPYAALARMLAEAVHRTRCSHFGLIIARDWHLADLGLPGKVVRHSATVGEALRALTACQRLNSQGGAVYLRERANSVSLGYAVFHPAVVELSAAYDLVIGQAANYMRELCGAAWNPAEVYLPRAAPPDAAPYRYWFRCAVHFDAEHAELRFPRSVMDRPVQGADPAQNAALEAEASLLTDDQIVPQLYRNLRLLLLDGMANGNAAAQQLEMHRRTFNRRLKAQGRTFQSMLDEVRFAVARQLLSETRLSVINIAGALGYAEASPFTRAFRRWAGMPPLRWRAARGALDSPERFACHGHIDGAEA